MDEKGFLEASRKGEDKHQGIVEAEAAHVVVAIQGATAVAEVLVGLQQAAAGPVDVLDDILVASVVESIHDGISVSRVESPDSLALILGVGFEGIIYKQAKKKMTLQSVDSEGFE